MKRILITGASGFVGKHLVRHFLDFDWHVTGLGTSSAHPDIQASDDFEWVSADTTRPGPWQDHVADADVIINLAGRNIFKRWTKTYKQAIYDSRIHTTRHLVEAMVPDKPVDFLSTSAAGIYGDAGERELTEDAALGSDFLAGVCKDWERAALAGKEKTEARVRIMRFGVVLGDGGALSVMSPAFKWFAGGPLGNGYQWFPWIHVDDLVKAMHFLIQTPDSRGIYNMVGPNPVRQRAFAKTLGQVLRRPAVMPAPGFMVKLVMGELGASLLNSQKAVPGALMDKGFAFSYPDVESALAAIFGNPAPA
ncbi:MAG: TIGR01777 family oxidoreductase [Desulfotignum sp.]|nr:TIGR01777 family oxidoreductase [Desulfotignum sp.]MCF8088029.1 TIGR01777 family oxidoreductase [Desulfotignum sp.]MCF8137777.1 TIGR01777 family oxidoreductase [Desulfotignum sp.]